VDERAGEPGQEAVLDRQVKLADGFPDLARGPPGRPTLALEQPQVRFEGQSRREDPVNHDVAHGFGDVVAFLQQVQGYLRLAVCRPGQRIVRRSYAQLILFWYHPVADRSR